MAATHLLIIGDREPLAWVVTAQRMAFPRGRVPSSLAEGDELLIYTTRGCFHNPTRDLGRIVARARVAGPVRVLPEPVRFGEREFTEGCELRIEALAPFRQGLVLRDLVPRLSVFPDPASWSVRLRRTVLTLPPEDAELIGRELAPHLRSYEETVDGYRTA
ncbi:hypothetical protein [Streptomyces macrosporus]|uniref:hypothetical protein n=1 Tax=Streptomyces macrosporus TaxID=44032 RepID=UPI0031DC1833